MAGYTNFPNGITSMGVPLPMAAAGIPFTGKYWFVNPSTGSDGNPGTSAAQPFATLYKAHASAVAGRNDVVVLIGNGAASGSARLSTALAQTVDPTATTGTLTWSKDATHLIGVCAPVAVGQRARIAPPSGTYTQATFGSGNFVVVSANGCLFQNIEIYNGFSTGGVNQIAVTVSGGRNAFINCNIQGMMDAASAADTGSRSVLITGTTGENTFYSTTIGGDTVTRSVANASLELAGATPRNQFVSCMFPFQTSAAGVLGILGTGANCIDRWALFEQCSFVNNIKSTSTQMTALLSFTNASPGGLVVHQDNMSVGITKLGDANGLANSYINMSAPVAATGGLGVNPS